MAPSMNTRVLKEILEHYVPHRKDFRQITLCLADKTLNPNVTSLLWNSQNYPQRLCSWYRFECVSRGDRADVYIKEMLSGFLDHPRFDVNALDGSGRALIHIIVDMEGDHFLKYFMSLKPRNLHVDIPTHDERQLTALHMACVWNDLEKVTCLLEGRADPNLVTGDGSSAIHVALRSERQGLQTLIIRYLLQYGADPNMTDGHGRSPLEVCIDPEIRKLIVKKGGSHKEIYKLLLENGGNATSARIGTMKRPR